MEDIKKLIQEVLEKGYLLSLATQDEGGLWVADVIYVHDENLNIYWLSQTQTRHSQAILTNNMVAGTVTVSNNQGEQNLGIQFEGVAEKIEGDVLEIAKKHRAKRDKPEPQTEGEILDQGESWYKITPTKIELIYEPFFGYQKRVLDLS